MMTIRVEKGGVWEEEVNLVLQGDASYKEGRA